MSDDLVVLASSRDLVIVAKPAGVPTEPDRDRRESLRDRLASWLRREGRFSREPHAVSRLDAAVSGAVTFAVTDRGTALAARLVERGEVVRRYVALCAGSLEGEGRLTWPVDGKPAASRFAVIARVQSGRGPIALVRLEPETGRLHQLRVHASKASAPILGDRRYGGPSSVATRGGTVLALGRVFLHALAVHLDLEGGPLEAVSPVPDDMRRIWAALDGAPSAWEETLR